MPNLSSKIFGDIFEITLSEKLTALLGILEANMYYADNKVRTLIVALAGNAADHVYKPVRLKWSI